MKWLFASVMTTSTLSIGLAAIALPTLAQEPKTVVTSSAVYACDEGKGFKAVYLKTGEARSVRATFGSKVFVLPSVETGSGAKYSDGSVTINTKGDEAFVEVGDKKLFTNCVAVGSVPGLW